MVAEVTNRKTRGGHGRMVLGKKRATKAILVSLVIIT